LSTCFSYFLPKQLNNVFFIQDFLHSPALRQVGNFDNTKIKSRLTKIYRPGQLIPIIRANIARELPNRLAGRKATRPSAPAKH
jgi:hypothetical protein